MGPDFDLRLAHSTVATRPSVVYDNNMEARMHDEKTKPRTTSQWIVVYSDNT